MFDVPPRDTCGYPWPPLLCPPATVMANDHPSRRGPYALSCRACAFSNSSGPQRPSQLAVTRRSIVAVVVPLLHSSDHRV
ncbi:hypothetical protein E2562_027237 [Oryza meyeriana var. granulata]|uniref:Uncharacterized protein n=1 Tax=Oryza meyeriana var. granulata TaxID=110450 RepID=A0A6G1D8P5_9ORYZ|nr:hypothetical protein E2562_027237 [Oryza meyeriana var. granulata]